MQKRHRMAALAAILFAAISLQLPAKDNKDEDKFVRLMSAKSVRLIEIDGRPFRKAEGPARFLHNNTWLICDTALWDVDKQIINALGNVKIEQENTELTSDSLVYVVETNMAKFRGALVQLRDKDNNTLRTHFLDYNTKDSVAVFHAGGAMRDKDGQLIESTTGTYDSKQKLFTFRDNVNMFTDSVFVKTSLLIYQADSSLATYPNYVEVWKDDNMLSANRGWYDKTQEKFFFNRNVHAMTDTRESWCDTLLYMRSRNDVDMFGNVQVSDTTKNVHSLSGQACYRDTVRTLTLSRKPVVIALVEDDKKDKRSNVKEPETKLDSVFLSSDTMVYHAVRKCDIPEGELAVAKKRLDEVSVDAIANIRAKAAEAAAKAQKEALEREQNAGQLPPPTQIGAKGPVPSPVKKGKAKDDDPKEDDEEKTEQPEQPKAETDSLDNGSKEPLDTTDIGYLYARGKVKMFRKSMQVCCDSLRYCDLDSLFRLYKDPVIWNDTRHQYNSDSLYMVVKNNRMDRAHLLSNAFIHIEEEENFYDQIRGAEMVAHFDDSTQLSRFDAMGSVTAIFFMKEKEKIATANRKETTVMSANFKNGEISDITYYENPKSDAYPVAQMKQEDKRLKGYKWNPDQRPKSSRDLTLLKPRPSERSRYEARPRAEFKQTEIYFKGYMAQVYRQIERSDSLRRVADQRRRIEKHRKDSLARVNAALADTTALPKAAADTSAAALPTPDSLAVNNLPKPAPNSLQNAPADTTALVNAPADSLASQAAPLSAKELKKLQKQKERAEKEALRAQKEKERMEALEKKWAEKDARDAAKKEEKERKKATRKHKHEQDILRRTLKQKAKEDAMLERERQRLIKEAEKGQFRNLVQPQD